MGKKIRSHLSAQLLCGVLVSLAAAAAAFALIFALCNTLLDHTVYGQAFERRMADNLFDDLQEYVDEEQIPGSQIDRLQQWFARSKRVYLMVFDGDEAVYTSPMPSGIRFVFDPENLSDDAAYTLYLADGTALQAYMFYYAGDTFYFIGVVLAAGGSILAFSVCFMLLLHRKVVYIKRLKGELDILSGGALEYPVTVQGEDELGQLAFGIDQMRRSILTHQRTEERTRSANSQLVTAMSHDLRTPLTSLLAYLELLQREKYTGEAQRRQFVKKSLEQTLRIKSMADDMFEYFLVYSAEWEQPDMDEQDADTLLEQAWDEYSFSLESRGFSVETDFQPLHAAVSVNCDLLHRAFDNLFSNLLKYADPTRPIRIAFRREGDGILLTVCNGISPLQAKRESTNIGLNTIQGILRYHGGHFDTRESGGVFTAELRLPISARDPL